ncbi:MAG: hypothetical protein LBS36_10450 [Oscillospiraceae bacterium]|jgi:uncharacterized protein involved in cysteine biosynthesis|nr:hypothetical protein [Oscillospiraceae bacterium]
MGWILTGFALIAVIDLVPLILQRRGRAIAAFLTVFVIALTIAVLPALGVQIPPVLTFFDKLFKSIGLSY